MSEISISRRDFLKMSAVAAGGLLFGKGLGELFSWYAQTPRKVGETLRQHPDWLAHTAKIVHSKTLQEIKSAVPYYPADAALGLNDNHMDMTTLMQRSIEQAEAFDPAINLTWDRTGAVSFEELEPNLPTLERGIGTFDINKFPKPVHNLIELGRTSDSFADYTPSRETFLSNFITPEMTDKIKQLKDAEHSELTPLIRKYILSSLSISEADKKYFDETEPIRIKYKHLISQATRPMAEVLLEIRKMIEQLRRDTCSPVSPSYVIGYFIYKNGGDIISGLTDSAFFFKVTARNDFETGVPVGDLPDSHRNTEWYKNNLLDIQRYASWNLMPGIDSSGSFGEPVDAKLVQQTSAINKDMLSNIRPENMTGSLYHLITNLSLCATLPWEVVAVPSISTVTLTGQGGIKFSRELAGLSEFPKATSFLDSYSK